MLVPNAYVERPKFEDRCFSTDIVMVRSYSSRVDGRLSQWGRVMKTRCFVYQLHESGTFFTPRSLEATMYLQLLLLMCVHMCWARMYRMLLFVCRPRPRTANDIIACTSVLAPPLAPAQAPRLRRSDEAVGQRCDGRSPECRAAVRVEAASPHRGRLPPRRTRVPTAGARHYHYVCQAAWVVGDRPVCVWWPPPDCTGVSKRHRSAAEASHGL